MNMKRTSIPMAILFGAPVVACSACHTVQSPGANESAASIGEASGAGGPAHSGSLEPTPLAARDLSITETVADLVVLRIQIASRIEVAAGEVIQRSLRSAQSAPALERGDALDSAPPRDTHWMPFVSPEVVDVAAVIQAIQEQPLRSMGEAEAFAGRARATMNAYRGRSADSPSASDASGPDLSRAVERAAIDRLTSVMEMESVVGDRLVLVIRAQSPQTTEEMRAFAAAANRVVEVYEGRR